MKISLSEIAYIEKHICEGLSSAELTAFEEKLSSDPPLRLKVFLQRKIHYLVKIYHRKQLKWEAQQAYQRLIDDPEKTVFQDTVHKLFKQ